MDIEKNYILLLQENKSINQFINSKVKLVRQIDPTPTIAITSCIKEDIMNYIISEHFNEIGDWYEKHLECFVRKDLLDRLGIH